MVSFGIGGAPWEVYASRAEPYIFWPAARRVPERTKPPAGGFAERGLALGELLAASRLVEADFLALDLARVASDEAGFLQRPLERLVVIDERAGDAVTHRTGLAGFAAAIDVHLNVE